MKSATAIKKFLGTPGLDGIARPASVVEIKEAKDACDPAEWAELGRQACEALGETFED